ncbi:MAG: O-antigen ligase family protein [Hyphomicrobiales bacterium]|nr:O-antigen ligase family protein [Hyphomicrobiales bacterium]
MPASASWTSRAHDVLLIGFLLLTFVGTHPFAGVDVAAREDGNLLDRIAVLSLFGLAAYVLWSNLGAALDVFIRNGPFWLVVAMCLASIFWSTHPDLTLRRAMLLVFLTTIAMAIAAGAKDARRMHTMMFVTLAAIMMVNLASVVVAPSLAISPIGVQGMYTQKNVAGSVAMITLIVGITWIFGAESVRSKILGAAVLALIAFFLVITRSRTSINLTVLGIAVCLFCAMCERYRSPFILLSVALGSILVVALMGWLAAYDFDFSAAMASIVSDTSFSGRDELWAFTLNDAEKRPWLGYGYGAYWDVGLADDPLVRAEPGSWLASVAIGVINQAHHGYLELWLHIGLPAMIFAALIIAWGALSGGAKAVFGASDRGVRALVGGMAAILGLHLLHNLTEATLFMRGTPFFNFATLAVFLISRSRFLEAR